MIDEDAESIKTMAGLLKATDSQVSDGIVQLKITICRLKELVRESYDEGSQHGSNRECSSQFGSRPDKYDCWEHSDAKAELDKTP